MKESTKSILVTVLKYLSAVIAGILGTLGATSCAVTRAKIITPREGSTTSITITSNQSVTPEVSPEIEATYTPK